MTLDLGGYRMGSMNETLDIEEKINFVQEARMNFPDMAKKITFAQEAGMNFPIWEKIILHK